MDRQWMYGDRCTMAWINGLKYFLDAAEGHKSSKGFMCCPCRVCQNKKEYSKRSTLHAHIYEHGVVMQDGEKDDDHNIADWAHIYEAGAFEDEPMDDVEEIDEAGENAAEDQPPDELGQVLVDSQKDCETLKESKKFEKMWEDHKKIL